MTEPLVGGCLCGAVRYRITAEPIVALYCHCRMCQQAHGAPAIAWLAVPYAGFAITAGEPTAYRSSGHAFRHFCGVCGTPLLCHKAASPRYMDVSIASLDTPEAVPPTLHIWTESKVPWFDTGDHLPRYPTGERPKKSS